MSERFGALGSHERASDEEQQAHTNLANACDSAVVSCCKQFCGVNIDAGSDKESSRLPASADNLDLLIAFGCCVRAPHCTLCAQSAISAASHSGARYSASRIPAYVTQCTNEARPKATLDRNALTDVARTAAEPQ